MAKKQFFAILDTETTINGTVADFGMVICDRHGEIFNRCAVLVKDNYGSLELFHDKAKNDIWGYAGLNRRKDNYVRMIESGERMLASVDAINRWLFQAIGKYNPTLTAYNLAFDVDKCNKTGIQLGAFNSKFCLWQAALGNICQSKKYRQFCIENHLFNPPTEKGNMTYLTNAEVVCGYITGNLIKEPHTAIEDAIDFELPILANILKKRDWRDNIKPYNWRDYQVKDNFAAN